MPHRPSSPPSKRPCLRPRSNNAWSARRGPGNTTGKPDPRPWGACWSRASPRWHRWLLSLPRLGPAIAHWERERSISRRTRWLALGLVTLSMAGTIWWFRGHAWLPWLLVALVVLLWLLILRLPVTPDEGGASLQQTGE